MTDVYDVLDEVSNLTPVENVDGTQDYQDEEAGPTEEELRRTHVVLMHDSFGAKYINVEEMSGAVTVNRVLGAADMTTNDSSEFFVNDTPVTRNTTVSAGDTIWVVGKLSGGK